MSNDIIFEHGSFRDPDGRVFYYQQEVYRTVSVRCSKIIECLLKADFFQRFIQSKDIVDTKILNNDLLRFGDMSECFLQHERIPFITYPHEWSFYMLKDAALLTLHILKEALVNNFILKDGTAWNVTFHNNKMCFFDVISIGEYQNGQAWEGYGQFCQEFLYPLLIKAHKNIDFQNFFKGSLSGITPNLANAIFSFNDWFKQGVFKHVFINAQFNKSKTIKRASLKNKFYLDVKVLINLATNLESIIKSLYPKNQNSLWSDYALNNTYSENDIDQKKTFILGAINKLQKIDKIIDLGCNTGEYSLMIANSNKNLTVFCCDLDADCIDQLYNKTKKESYKNIYPFVLDLMNPSSMCGWDLKERKSIWQRINVDAFLVLALVHHICIAYNVPLEIFIKFLSSIASQGIIEWVDKQDPMVQFLLRNRKDIFYDYEWKYFENIIIKYFHLAEVKTINNGTRKLCLLLPKKNSI
ncbi:MAG: class I SAM-dependent methyltransferase [Gammaproteobacteria bacterium]